MATVTINQTGNGIEAIKNFGLAISWGWSFEQAFEFGSDQLDNEADEKAYLIFCTGWKAESLSIEVNKMQQDEAGNIIGWELKEF